MKLTGLGTITSSKQFLASAALVLACGVAMSSAAAASDDDDKVQCSDRTLRGVYFFHASGFNIVNGAALPKAIIETLIFDGYGNVSTPAVSLSVNGNIIRPPQGNPGVYAVDADCTGTLNFDDVVTFDLQVKPTGGFVNMLQTNPNTVMQGTAEKVSSVGAWGG
jgi:hypothetical protein